MSPPQEEVVLLLRRQSKGFARTSSRARAAAKAHVPSRPLGAAGRRAALKLEPDTPAAAEAREEVCASAPWAPAPLVAASPVFSDAESVDCLAVSSPWKYNVHSCRGCQSKKP